VNNKLFFNLLFIISDKIRIFHDQYYCLHKWNVKHNLQILHVISVKIIYILSVIINILYLSCF